jgi:hypothetical protein
MLEDEDSGFRSSGPRHGATGSVTPDILKKRTVFVFNVQDFRVRQDDINGKQFL